MTDDELFGVLLAAIPEIVDEEGYLVPSDVPVEGLLATPCSHYKFNSETLQVLGLGHLAPPGGGFIITVDDDGGASLHRFPADPELEQGWAAMIAHHMRPEP